MRGVSASPDCLFCRIVAGDVPADVVHESAQALAFRDVSPQAPTHVLVVPRGHHADVAELAAADPRCWPTGPGGRRGGAGRGVGCVPAGVQHRVHEAGQSVFHVHGHVLGGRDMRLAAGLSRRHPVAWSVQTAETEGQARAGRHGRPWPRPRAVPQRAQQHKIVVPSSVPMVSLLGSGDELLRVVESAFPGVDIHVRGNEITMTGEPGDVALVERLLDELVAVLAHRPGLTPEAVERSVAMLRRTDRRAARRRADAQHPVQPRPHDPARRR